jgi:hypothetical protein
MTSVFKMLADDGLDFIWKMFVRPKRKRYNEEQMGEAEFMVKGVHTKR